MNPKECKYTVEHEWIFSESGGNGKSGITEYAQFHLGDIVFLDLPAPGTDLEQFQKMGEIESVKAVSGLLSPASGRVLEINQAAIDEPKLVNEDPYGAGWLVKLELSKPSELDTLMNSDEYDEFIAKLYEENSEQEEGD